MRKQTLRTFPIKHRIAGQAWWYPVDHPTPVSLNYRDRLVRYFRPFDWHMAVVGIRQSCRLIRF
jgi:hypothetical protein